MAALSPALPVLHLCHLQPQLSSWTLQEEFAASHSWFHPHRLDAHGHFAAFEIPEKMAYLIEAFVAD
jgi:hypothetical protein